MNESLQIRECAGTNDTALLIWVFDQEARITRKHRRFEI